MSAELHIEIHSTKKMPRTYWPCTYDGGNTRCLPCSLAADALLKPLVRLLVVRPEAIGSLTLPACLHDAHRLADVSLEVRYTHACKRSATGRQEQEPDYPTATCG
eukprot:scpid94662/ scgid23662/ 